MSGVNFSGDMNLSGTWINPKTEEQICVKDCIIEDGQMVILTTNGRQYSYDQFQQYTKISDKKLGYKPPKKQRTTIKQPQENSTSNTLTTKLTNTGDELYKIEDESIFYDPITTAVNPHPQTIPTTTIPPNKSSNPVYQALDNLPIDEQPMISVDVSWDNNEIVEFLTKYMGASIDDIVECVVEKFCNYDSIKEIIKETITATITPIDEQVIEKPKRGRPKKGVIEE